MNKQASILLYTNRKQARTLRELASHVVQLEQSLASGTAHFEAAKQYVNQVVEDYECLKEAVNNMGAAAVLETDIEGMAYYIVPAAAMEAVLFHFAPSGAMEEVEE